MYLDDEHFITWMEKLFNKLGEIGKDLRAIMNTKDILEEGEKILDNQDLCFLLKVSNRSLQRYRNKGILPYFKVEGRIYYKATELREFIQKHSDSSDTRWQKFPLEDNI